MRTFEGVYVAVVTPFTKDFEVDEPKLREHVEWLIASGVHGLVPTGSCGEYAALSDAERARVVEVVVAVARGRVPVVVGVAAPTTRGVVAWAEHAKRVGAEGVMALPPIQYRPSWDEVFAHYQALDRVGLPIVVYNNPHDTAVDITPPLLKRLSELPNVVAVKEFSGDVRRVTDILTQTNLQVIAGTDDLCLESFFAGATGWIAGMANIVPEESVRLYGLARERAYDEAWALYRRLLPLLRYDSTPQLVQAIKYGLEVIGRPVGRTRPPRTYLAEADQRTIADVLKATRGLQ